MFSKKSPSTFPDHVLALVRKSRYRPAIRIRTSYNVFLRKIEFYSARTGAPAERIDSDFLNISTKKMPALGKRSPQRTALFGFFRQVARSEARSALVVIFLERFLDMLQNRFSIGFRRVGPFVTRINRRWATMLAIHWKRGSEFGFDAIPISTVHHRSSAQHSRCEEQNTAARRHK
jgi:hypothetical protein